MHSATGNDPWKRTKGHTKIKTPMQKVHVAPPHKVDKCFHWCSQLYCYGLRYWRPMMELLSLMTVMSEGLGFNLCVAPFLNVCVPNLPQGQGQRMSEVVRVGLEVVILEMDEERLRLEVEWGWRLIWINDNIRTSVKYRSCLLFKRLYAAVRYHISYCNIYA